MDKRIPSAETAAEDNNVDSDHTKAFNDTQKVDAKCENHVAEKLGLEPSDHEARYPSNEDRRDDFFDDAARVRAYRDELLQARIEVLGISRAEAEEWTDATIRDHRAMAEGTLVSRLDRPIPFECTLEAMKLTVAEVAYWKSRMEFRTKELGLSVEEAEEWTRDEIEYTRMRNATDVEEPESVFV